jgi:membrane protein implicated in regulation of membrane protease activity
VTIVILLILVALLWAAVLAPSVWRRFVERRGVGSIDHFHHQLQLLEHASPKTVEPAYRLHTLPGLAGPASAPPAAVDTARPKLVLLRPTDDVAVSDVDDREGGHYERVGVLDRPEPACRPDVDVDLRSFRRAEARRRGTTLLRCLAGVAVSTGLIGLVPGMAIAWVFTVATGLAALALLGLMAYAKELEAEQVRRRGRIRGGAAEAPAAIGRAEAGFPGAWDELDDVPIAAAAGR